MGPRPDGRGNIRIECRVCISDAELQWGRDQMVAEISRAVIGEASNIGELQWGRDQMVAEINQDHWNPVGAGPLQWGRDQMVAEIEGIRFFQGFYISFNGAATRWSRKL